MLTVWPAEDRAVVVIVGPHSRRSGDVYDQLLTALGVDTPAEERKKPPCCDDEGLPPSDEETADVIAGAIERSARRSRRPR